MDENIVEKGENAVYQHFSFFPTFFFQKVFFSGSVKSGLCGKGMTGRKELSVICYHTILKKKSIENIVGKGENAGNQHFHLFPQYFLPYQRNESEF